MTDRSTRGLSLEKTEFTGNTSGWQALDYKVFVRKDTVTEKTSGGIIVPEDVKKQEAWNVQTGVIISMGSQAFTDGRRADGEFFEWGGKPKPGDRVMVKEFSGLTFTGSDGVGYMVFADKDIAGVSYE